MNRIQFYLLLLPLLTLFSCSDAVVQIVELDVLVDSRAEPPGSNCASGGTEVSVGLDDDGSGILEADEVGNVFYVCNGVPGTTGGQGATGSTGPQGATGPSGTSGGPDLLVNTDSVSPGVDCPNGGVLVEMGLDVNNNEILEAEEVMESFYICNGLNGSTGPTGPQGPSGPTGVTGPQGPTGLPGSTG